MRSAGVCLCDKGSWTTACPVCTVWVMKTENTSNVAFYLQSQQNKPPILMWLTRHAGQPINWDKKDSFLMKTSNNHVHPNVLITKLYFEPTYSPLSTEPKKKKKNVFIYCLNAFIHCFIMKYTNLGRVHSQDLVSRPWICVLRFCTRNMILTRSPQLKVKSSEELIKVDKICFSKTVTHCNQDRSLSNPAQTKKNRADVAHSRY